MHAEAAGDGAQRDGAGMNVGIQDAHNLGWKLAAVATGRADDALLDTNHSERQELAERLSGLGVAHGTGRRVGNVRLSGGSTLSERLRAGSHVATDEGLVRPDGHLV